MATVNNPNVFYYYLKSTIYNAVLNHSPQLHNTNVLHNWKGVLVQIREHAK